MLILGGIVTAFLAPIKGLIILMVLFVTLDTFAGIFVMFRKEGWTGFRSHKLFNLVIKSFFYLMTIIMAYFADVHLLNGSFMDIKLFLSKSICVVWCYVEMKSIDEKSQKLGNKSIWTIIQELIGKLKGIKKDLNEITEEEKESDANKPVE
ncbi:phage holin family protein [Flavobacterium sp.]|uniref:phage holin family protein n=1 Tax=Flavobacterium sp. TaxID=239 RepID=UPI0025C1354A|nr:phage holin family protein [Flavobacterium sp.]